jgi:predicted phage gp36 major capsid-like protein
LSGQLSGQLQLSREQCEQMRPIWEAARDAARSCSKEAERIQFDHEEQLKALLTDEQKARYEQLSQENHRRIAAEDARRKEAFHKALESTQKILRADQWRAYEQIVKNQVGSVPGEVERTLP